MIFNLISGYMRGTTDFQLLLIQTVFTAITVLLALTVHELSHGYTAYRLGDPTARSLGRLTLDPRKHLDPIGTISMLLFGFGWAKPVPVNSRYFKKPRRDMALTALAGPASNVILSFIGLLLARLFTLLYINLGSGSGFISNLVYFTVLFFMIFHTLNLYLAVFNLIPIPPLDGSRILFIFLPNKYYFGIMKYERYISLVIMLLLVTGWLSAPIGFLADKVSDGMSFIIGLIPGL